MKKTKLILKFCVEFFPNLLEKFHVTFSDCDNIKALLKDSSGSSLELLFSRLRGTFVTLH